MTALILRNLLFTILVALFTPQDVETPVHALISLTDAPSIGDARARIGIVEFSDYQCPFCLIHSNQALPQIVREYVNTGRVRYFFKDLWPYASKFGGSNNVVPAGGFFEGGIDITELFGGIPGNEPCISSFLMETRSSQSTTAVLKDFVAGGFNTCGEITVHKDCNCDHITADGTLYHCTD